MPYKNVVSHTLLLYDARAATFNALCSCTFFVSYGWCGTIHNYTSFAEQRLEISESDGWGFCQRSCFPKEDEELGGVERHKDVQVIDPDYCQKKLFVSAKKKGFKIEPKVKYNPLKSSF